MFVGNLSWNIDDEWLYREFEEFGEISGARVISDKATGRSKGFGYVEFETVEGLQKALDLSGSSLQGRSIRTSVAEPREYWPIGGFSVGKPLANLNVD